MDAALEAVKEAVHAGFVTIAKNPNVQRKSFLPPIGDKGLPAKPLAESGDGVCLTRDMGDVVASFLDHALLAAHRAAAPAHVLGGLLDLLFPCHAEQPGYPMLFEHEVNRLHECR